MKTSNKLILFSIVIIVVSLVGYDFLLKAEYLSGNYKIPFKDYKVLKWKDFDKVDVNGSTAANVKFVQGPFSVRIDNYAVDFVNIKQKANRLQIDADFKDGYLSNQSEYLIVISCPKLNSLYVNATYQANNRQVTDTIVRDGWNMRKISIDGFTQDTLNIIQDYGSTVLLANNSIRTVKGIIGKSSGSGSKIIIAESNWFGEMSLDIDHNSTLQLENGLVNTLGFRLSDSARLIVSGKAQNLLNNSKPLK